MHPLLAKEAFSCLQPRNHASGKSNAIHHLSDITASYMYAKLFRGTPWNVLSRYSYFEKGRPTKPYATMLKGIMGNSGSWSLIEALGVSAT